MPGPTFSQRRDRRRQLAAVLTRRERRELTALLRAAEQDEREKLRRAAGALAAALAERGVPVVSVTAGSGWSVRVSFRDGTQLRVTGMTLGEFVWLQRTVERNGPVRLVHAERAGGHWRMQFRTGTGLTSKIVADTLVVA